MPGRAHELLGFGHFHRATQIHDHDAMADVFDHGEVVRDEQVGQPVLLLQIHEQVHDLRLHRNIKRTDRFVAHDELRLHGQRARDANALALPAAELMRVTLVVGRIKSDRAEQIADARPPRSGAVGQPVDVNRLADDLAHGHAWVERAVGVLENHLELAATGAQRFTAQLRDVLALEKDAPRRRLKEPDDGAAQRGLATAAFAHEPERFAGSELQAHVIHGLHMRAHPPEESVLDREMDFEVVDFEEVHRGERRWTND